MEIKEIRKYLYDKYDCIEGVVIIDLLNVNTLETTGVSVSCQLSNKHGYDIETLAEIRNEIGADSCAVFVNKGRINARFRIHNS
ncbi:MAG: hypothetical protein K6G73_12555 [Marinilabiliaceae bacterium]|nr:hypothetical protein [Marinilabiliaceae bacterium]